MLHHKISEMFRELYNKERKEHPWLSDNQVERLVKDHIKHHHRKY